MNKDLKETLNELRIEDIIWVIYIFIAIFAIVSNHFERKFELKHQKKDAKTFQTINTDIFIITFIIYLYFLYINYKRVKKLNPNSSLKEIITTQASFIVAILFLIGGLISLLISIFGTNEEDDVFLNFF